MQYGISPEKFWEYSLLEVCQLLYGITQKRRRELKEKISFGFMLSRLVGERVASIVDDKIEISMPWDYYPELFAEEREQCEKTKKEQELEDYKAERKAYVQLMNKKRQLNGQ